MVLVIKRRGHEEPFDAQKLSRCLAAISDEIEMPLGKADLSRITTEVQSVLAGREKVFHYEIAIVTSGVLLMRGFTGLAGAYVSFVKA